MQRARPIKQQQTNQSLKSKKRKHLDDDAQMPKLWTMTKQEEDIEAKKANKLS